MLTLALSQTHAQSYTHIIFSDTDLIQFYSNEIPPPAAQVCASEQGRIISRIKVFPFPLHLGFSNYGGEISLRTLSPADKHACTHRQARIET